MVPDISYLEHQYIDKQKWDHCIEHSANRLIYPNSWYLDQMADSWDALVAGDYQWVMPLTFRKKLGVKYLYQPPFTQQLGVFGRLFTDENMMALFIKEASKRFGFAEIFLNRANRHTGAQPRSNFILNLQQSYSKIEAGFKEDLRKNLKRSKTFGLHYYDSEDYHEAIYYYRREYSSRIGHLGDKEYRQFTDLCSIAFEKKMILIRKVNRSGSGPLAIALFLKDGNRLYNIMSTTLEEGRRIEANHFLFEQLIREFANNNLILDFEGSDIEGIARFYQKFGAMNEPYFYLKFNNLGWPIKFLKK